MNVFRRNVKGRIAAVVVAAVGAAVLTAGCGSSSSTGSGKSSAKASVATLKRAAYVSTAAPGFKLAMAVKETMGGQTAATVNANGSFSPSSRTGQMAMNMQGQVSGGAQNMNMQAVLDGNNFYIKFPPALASQIPGGKPWVSFNFVQLAKASGMSGLGSMMSGGSTMYNPGQYLDYLRAAAGGSVKNLGQETLDGHQVTHYRAEINLANLVKAVPASQRQAARQLLASMKQKASGLVTTQIPVDVWIDSSNLVRRIQMTYSMSMGGQSGSLDMTENFSDYGPQPAPTIPGPDETTNLLSLLQSSGVTQGA